MTCSEICRGKFNLYSNRTKNKRGFK